MVSISKTGEVSSIIGASRLEEPVALAIYENDLFVADYQAHVVVNSCLKGSKETQRIEVSWPKAIAFDPTRERLYIASRMLSVVDLKTGKTDAVFPEHPNAVCLSPDRRRLYVAVVKPNETSSLIVELSPTMEQRTLCTVPHIVSSLTTTPAGLLAIHTKGLTGINLQHGTFTTVWNSDDTSKKVRGAVALPTKNYAITCGNLLLEVPRDGSAAKNYAS